MYSYTYDTTTGGIILNSSPTNFSKEPRPVYAAEMDILGFDRYWNYDKQNNTPYMWAESNAYWYKGVLIAKVKGGNLYTAPKLQPVKDETGEIMFSKTNGYVLEMIDIIHMCELNKDLLAIVEDSTVKKIVKEYEKFKDKLDIFHVAFSGGKDSAVLLDLVKKTLPKGSFVVIFGDTGMEFPDTYETIKKTQEQCEKDGTPFYIARSHFKPENSWNLFGPPARVLRWCCSVHKSTPQTLKLREITGKKNYVGMDFVGVRAHESITRSKYGYENFGKKQKGQYSFNPILEWTSAEIWLYIFLNNIYINKTYKKGNSRAGCLFCPMGGGRGDFLQYTCYPKEVGQYVDIIKSLNARNAGDTKALNSYVSNGGWNARKNGRDLKNNQTHYCESINDGTIQLDVTEPQSNWKEWIKTVRVPFKYNITEHETGYNVTFDSVMAKKFPHDARKFRQVFKKAAHCIGCKVCETNCRNGKIRFLNGKIRITDCTQCGMCHEIDDGCLVYHSLKTTNGDIAMRKESLNSFANHAPKIAWVQDFFELGNEFWESERNTLNKKLQVPMFKKFLRGCGFIDDKNNTTQLFNIVSSSKYGCQSGITWGLALSNFAYNAQCKWYIENMDIDVCYERNHISDMLVAEGVKKDDASSIINAYKRFCQLPLGTVFNFGFIEEKGHQIDILCRTKCTIDDARIVLYAIYKFTEKCNMEKEFHVSYLFDENVERDGVSPVRIFGLYNEEELKSILLGLSAAYPEFINATFTNDLQTVTLRDKTSIDVLELFKGDL